MKTTLLFAIITGALITNYSFAAESLSEEEKENNYQMFCVPNSDKLKNEPAEELQKLASMKKQYFNFLQSPEKIVSELKKGPLFNKEADQDFGSVMGSALMFAMTCGITDAIQDKIESRGCSDGQKSYSAQKAMKLCAPLIEESKKQDDSNE